MELSGWRKFVEGAGQGERIRSKYIKENIKKKYIPFYFLTENNFLYSIF